MSIMSSFPFDYVTRQKLGGVNLTFFIVEQIPVLTPRSLDDPCLWKPSLSYGAWMTQRIVELIFTANDIKPCAAELGDTGSPFLWDRERRSHLKVELDACLFILYGLSREDTAYVLDTFPIVRRKDEAAFGEYRTKRLILEAFDGMSEAIATGTPYVSPLDPPPGHGPRHENLSEL